MESLTAADCLGEGWHLVDRCFECGQDNYLGITTVAAVDSPAAVHRIAGHTTTCHTALHTARHKDVHKATHTIVDTAEVVTVRNSSTVARTTAVRIAVVAARKVGQDLHSSFVALGSNSFGMARRHPWVAGNFDSRLD